MSNLTFSLFALQRPGGAIRYLFVNDRSAEVRTFWVQRNENGAAISDPEEELVQLWMPLSGEPSETVALRECAGELRHVRTQPSGALTMACTTGDWVATAPSENHLQLKRSNSPVSIRVETKSESPSGTSATYEVSTNAPSEYTRTVCKAVIESLAYRQALRLPRNVEPVA